MQNLNKINLIGNVGQDPELQHTPGGTPVLRIRLATNVAVPTKDDPKRQRTDWHTCVVFGRRAEGLAKAVKKGAGLFVEGRLEINPFEKDGVKRISVQVVVDDLLFLSSASNRGAASSDAPEDEFSDAAE